MSARFSLCAACIGDSKHENSQANVTIYSSKFKPLQIYLTPTKRVCQLLSQVFKIFQIFYMCKVLNEISTSLTKQTLK